MVSQSLDQAGIGSLRQQGYHLEMTHGWDTHQVPLYTHREVGDKKPGDIAFHVRVGNLKSMDRAEGQYVARKGAVGFFMWPPDECLDHEFTKLETKPRPGGGVISEKVGPKLMS